MSKYNNYLGNIKMIKCNKMKYFGFYYSCLLHFGNTVLWYSAIKADYGECVVSIGLHRGGRSFHHCRSRPNIIWSLFRRGCYYCGDSSSCVTSISDAKSHKYRIEIWFIDRSLNSHSIYPIFFSGLLRAY